MTTSQPIPLSLSSYSFEIKMESGCDDISVGMQIDDNFIQYISDIGYFQDDQDGTPIFDQLEPFGDDDVIGCHMRSISAGDNVYKYLKFYKNGKVVGSRVVDGKFLRPRVKLYSLKNETKIRSYLGTTSSGDVLGNKDYLLFMFSDLKYIWNVIILP